MAIFEFKLIVNSIFLKYYYFLYRNSIPVQNSYFVVKFLTDHTPTDPILFIKTHLNFIKYLIKNITHGFAIIDFFIKITISFIVHFLIIVINS